MLRTLISCTLLAAAIPASFSTGTEPPVTMRAIRVTAFGGPEVLKLSDVPRPSPGPGEVLVRVKAAGINPVDWKIREGNLKGMAPPPPFTPGYDIAGVVESLGEGSSGPFKLGDAVFAYLPLTSGGGYAEYVSVPTGILAKRPVKADWNQAAGTPLAGLTAWQALFDHAKLQSGQTVLIHAGAGGVGHLAIQFAKSRGIRVLATASAENLEFLKELGADVAIDYKAQKFEDVVKEKAGQVDAVLDSIGGDTQARSLSLIKKGGTLVSIVQPPDAAKCKQLGINGKIFLVQPNGGQLAEIAALMDSGTVSTFVSRALPLADAANAQELSKTGRTKGKIVLNVSQ